MLKQDTEKQLEEAANKLLEDASVKQSDRKILQRFLGYHRIKNIYGKKIRVSHLCRRVRKHFPEIAQAVNPEGAPWTKRRVSKLVVFMRDASPQNYTPISMQKNGQAPQAAQIRKAVRTQRKKTRAEKQKFYDSWEWTKLRYQTLKKYGAKCMLCGVEKSDGATIHVDHIKPLHTHWELRLNPDNLQVLCKCCNKGKGAWDETDWRDN